jgi:hypothetical protein
MTNEKVTPNARDLTAIKRAQAASAPPVAEARPATIAKPAAALRVATPQVPTVFEPVTPDEYRQRYLDEVAPSGVVGRLIKFGKDGTFITPDDNQDVPMNTEFVALCDQTLVGWLKFNGPGEMPDRQMGLLYDGFIMPTRESLGDLDPTKWEAGLDGQPNDPWIHQICLVLQNAETSEMYTFVTSSKTGRRAVGTLLKHYDRMQRTNPDELPRVRLGTGGFEHRDSRIGHVAVPVFIVIGRSPRDGVATPETTTTAAYLDDGLPF